MKISIQLTKGQIKDIKLALQLAISYENALIDAHSHIHDGSEIKIIKQCNRNIKNWKAILYYLGE